MVTVHGRMVSTRAMTPLSVTHIILVLTGSQAPLSVHRDFTTLIRLELVSGQGNQEGKQENNSNALVHDFPREDCASDDDGGSQRRKKKPKDSGGPAPTTRKPAEALSNGFTCPGGPIGVHPALPHPKDCRLYYVCLDGLTPSDAGCTHGKVFNPTTQQCDNPTNVEGEI